MELMTINDAKSINLTTEASKQIAEIERQIKELKATQEAIKQALIEEMEKYNVIKIDTDDVTITYVAQIERETFDTKLFKEENPLIYDSYVKMTPVSPSVRIKVK